MEIRRLTGTLGAEVTGLHLETISDTEFTGLHEALIEHQVVFLREQHLSPDGHRSLSWRFGTPSVFPLQRHFGGTEVLGLIEDTEENGPDADTWHTDITWIDAPPKIAILAALDIPPYGGDTLWADLYSAYDGLSPTMRVIADGLRVRHSQGEAFWAAIGKRFDPERVSALRVAFPGAEHPLVRTHPITGRKALFVAGTFMESIAGMDPDESAWMLDHFRHRIDESKLQVRWSWTVGDVAIWDERSTVHMGEGSYWPAERLMRRVTAGSAPPVVT